MTYLPATLAWLALRIIVRRSSAGAEDGTTLAVQLDNRELWADPMFAGLFFYFLLTIGGGVSLLVAARAARCWRLVRQEPEWLSYAAVLLVLTALGGADLWRYLTPLLPVVAAFYAWCLRGAPVVEQGLAGAAVVALTWWTQTPLKHMDSASYFADWFPYYIWMREYPFPAPPPSLWPDWGWRFLVVTLSLGVLTAYFFRQHAHGATR